MPDALSKTVPIWCAVLNEASRRVHGKPNQGGSSLHLYARMVSDSEASQIEELLDGWVTAFIVSQHTFFETCSAGAHPHPLQSSDLPIPLLPLPLVPRFVIPSDAISSVAALHKQTDVLHVVCVSASRSTPTPDVTTTDSWIYIQGAGDDEESWAQGLTPATFWRRREEILASREACTSTIERIVEQGKVETASSSKGALSPSRIQGTPIDLELGAGSVGEDRAKDFALVVDCEAAAPSSQRQELEQQLEPSILQLGLVPGKAGLRAFRAVLPSVIVSIVLVRSADAELTRLALAQNSVTSALLKQGSAGKSVLIAGSLGSDLPGAVAVAVLSASFDGHRNLVRHVAGSTEAPGDLNQEALERHRAGLSKDDARRRLQWLLASVPQASPSRAHLLRVNEVLLSPQYRAAAAEESSAAG